MKPLLVTLGTLGLVIAASQTLRHLYVAWMPPNASLIDRFDDRVQKDPLASLGIDELAKQYEAIRREVRAKEAGKNADERGKFNIWEEPYKTEDKLRNAIQIYEARQREVMETHFFWWAGLVIVGMGVGLFAWQKRWLAVAAMTTGFIEMFYATNPTLRFLGGMAEFDRLILWKLIYSALALAALIALWLGLDRALRPSGGNF